MFSYFNCLGKYATFSGRATRREFWLYNLINIIILSVMVYFFFAAKTDMSRNISATVLIIYLAITISPTCAVMSRRWHDLGSTGNWLWLNLVPVVGTFVSYCFMMCKGEDCTNEYGRNPLEKRFRKKR